MDDTYSERERDFTFAKNAAPNCKDSIVLQVVHFRKFMQEITPGPNTG